LKKEEEPTTEAPPAKEETSESTPKTETKDEAMEVDNKDNTNEDKNETPQSSVAAAAAAGAAASDNEEHNNNNGGGKRSYNNRHNNRNSRRYTPYSNSGKPATRAVFQQDHDSDPKKRVYVGNLSWDVTWRELKDHMKTTGCEVTRADVMATPDGRSKGCGIVEFATEEGASRAVLTLNDTELLGRQIFVREDREDGSGGGYYAQQLGGGYHQHNHHSSSSGGGGGNSGRFTSGAESQSRRVYVGNLSWDVAWQDLKDHMRQAGEVAYAEVMSESDGRSKGCGIVEFASAEEAQEAISTLTDSELKGRMIFVREDRETASGGGEKSGGGGGGSGGGGKHHGNNYGSTSVYVGNLAYETSWQDLKDHMRAAGNVDQANVLSSEDGRSKGCGIVQYQKPQEAARAIRELQNSVLNGRPIFVREDREQSGGGGGGRHHHKDNNSYKDRNDNDGGGGCQLFVGNLSFDTSWRELKDHFRQCGDVERADVMEAPDGRKKGFGTVRFYKAKDASNAIQRLNGVELQGRCLEVRIDHKA